MTPKLNASLEEYCRELSKLLASGRATEHSYRSVLQTFLEENLADVKLINEPRRMRCGAPDFAVMRCDIVLGYVETKDLGKSLDDKGFQDQFQRYRKALDNLIFTNYLQFRFVREDEDRQTIAIAHKEKDKIVPDFQAFLKLKEAIQIFATYQGISIKSANELAKLMAVKSKMLAEEIEEALNPKPRDLSENRDTDLNSQYEIFKEMLLSEITKSQFADLYAQTVAYGMFAARLQDSHLASFSREEATQNIPINNPFLRKFFHSILGYDADKRIEWIVKDLAAIFRNADIAELLKDYYQKQEDPFLHFYETYLGKYNPKLRKSRGVYYTPKPVVQFIVKAVDEILKNEFQLPRGLANRGKTTIEIERREEKNGTEKTAVSPKTTKEIHKVQILDPATGTGTFLAEIIEYLHCQYFKTQQGSWKDYVKEHLIPRLHGFEIMMAPYTVAHTKLDFVLHKLGCRLQDEERLSIFLSDTLGEQGRKKHTEKLPFASWLSAEAKEANRIKNDTPVMVVLGNPPYSGESENKSDWIESLMETYKKEPNSKEKLKEKNSKWINDDYVKFIRYGQHLIDRTGEGVLAYINNHSFLDNPTFRGMRWSLLQSFDKIYILDLHGNVKKREVSPDGSPDKNVFDIQQGVSINLFVKTGKRKKDKLAEVLHCDVYGEREQKYEFLQDHNLAQLKFQRIETNAKHYFFVPKDYELEEEYKKGFSIEELFELNGVGITTAHDDFVINEDKIALLNIYKKFQKGPRDVEFLHQQFNIKKKKGWNILDGYENIKNEENLDKYIKPIAYRPFDNRFIFYEKKLVWRPVKKIMQHFLGGENVGLVLCRQFKTGENYQHGFITKNILESSLVSNRTSEIGYVFPLYLYPEQGAFDEVRWPNLKKEILGQIAANLGLRFTDEKENDPKTFAPLDLLDYIYAVLHSPAYRERYKEFLKIDFPRVPYPNDIKQFRSLVSIGSQLRELHLLESPQFNSNSLITEFSQEGSGTVQKAEFEILPTKKNGKLWINETQYFDKVPKIAWEFYIGGYQPAQKWLKDRKTKTLSYDDTQHYQKIIVALVETQKLMQKTDEHLCAK